MQLLFNVHNQITSFLYKFLTNFIFLMSTGCEEKPVNKIRNFNMLNININILSHELSMQLPN